MAPLRRVRPRSPSRIRTAASAASRWTCAARRAARSGFGQTGPLAGRASYDIVAQATGGLLAMTGFPDGPPVRGGGALADFVGGLYLGLGLVAALYERNRTGQAGALDLSNQAAVF